MTLKALMAGYVDLNNLHDYEGDYPTRIDNVRFYRSEKGHQRKPTMYKSGLIILGQGNKALYAGGERIPYAAGDCLVMGVPMPVECEAYRNSDEPLLGMGIEIPIHILQKQVAKIKSHPKSMPVNPSNSKLTIRREPIDDRLRKACTRLMEALCDDLEAEVLGESLLEEVIFFALLSKGGDTLFTLADQAVSYTQV